MSATIPVTAEQLLRMPDDGHRYELVAGELKMMTPAGWEHGIVASQLNVLVGRFVAERNLGWVFGAETGFRLARDPDTVRAPDLAFIPRDRLPSPPPEESFWPGAPDLAVEVVSPGDRPGQVEEKAKDWIQAGARMVWVVSPSGRTVTVYRPGAAPVVLRERDELDGEDVLPGFRCRVGDLFIGRAERGP